MGYLFMVSIGPIQSFIASARRTRDLWFGSRLLSELSKAAALAIVDGNNNSNELIFPSPTSSELLQGYNDFNVANKIVAYIESDPAELGELVYKRIQQSLTTMMDQLVHDVKANNFDVEVARQQVEELVEYVWVSVPFDRATDADVYATKRDLLEELLAARKNTRLFASVAHGSTRLKSSIDGQLESVIPEESYPRRADDEKKRRKLRTCLYYRYRAGIGERLSGVDLLKRCGRFTKARPSEEEDFLSTSHVAALPYLASLQLLPEPVKRQARTHWQQYMNSVIQIVKESEPIREPNEYLSSVFEWLPKRRDDLRHDIIGMSDGGMLFGERLLEDLADTDEFERAQQPLRKFFEFLKGVYGRSIVPSPYYAILCADGDGMGKVIDAAAKQPQGMRKHQEISRQLATFSGKVRNIVERDHQGTLIYAGGDDVLAFVPLHTVLDCAQELSQTFKKQMESFGATNERPPTLSVGIAIVHHLSLLQESLNRARAAEKRAKSLTQKNALALTICKRSGEEYSIVGEWGDIDVYLKQIIPYFLSPALRPEHFSRQIGLSRGAAYEIREMVQRLTPHLHRSDASNSNELKIIYSDLQDIMHVDAIRILQRKLQASGRIAEADLKVHLNFFKRRLGLLASLNGAASEAEPVALPAMQQMAAVTIEEFVHELIVAQELAAAQELAMSVSEAHKEK